MSPRLVWEPPFACVQIIVSLVISAGGQERPGHQATSYFSRAATDHGVYSSSGQVGCQSEQQVQCISLVCWCVIIVTTSDVIFIIGGTMANINTQTWERGH